MADLTTDEKLRVALTALERIAESDPGPAYYTARAALEEIGSFDKEGEEQWPSATK